MNDGAASQAGVDEVKTCRRCDREVSHSLDSYELYERMHYVCFHYLFEHGDTDVDVPCSAPPCPSSALAQRR